MNILTEILFKKALKEIAKKTAFILLVNKIGNIIANKARKLRDMYLGFRIDPRSFVVERKPWSLSSLPTGEEMEMIDTDSEVISFSRFKLLFSDEAYPNRDAKNNYRLISFKTNVGFFECMIFIRLLNLLKCLALRFTDDNDLLSFGLSDHGLQKGSRVACFGPVYKDMDIIKEADVLIIKIVDGGEKMFEEKGRDNKKDDKKSTKIKNDNRNDRVKILLELHDFSRDEFSAGTFFLVKDCGI